MSGVRRRPTAAAEQLEWDKANNKVLKVLFTSVSDEQLAYVIEEDLAESVWNCLKTLHGQSSDKRLWQLLQKQFDIAQKCKERSAEFLFRFGARGIGGIFEHAVHCSGHARDIVRRSGQDHIGADGVAGF